MFGLRCMECGEVRWTLFGRPTETDPTCPVCGAEMVEERRHPGRFTRDAVERRDEAVLTPGRPASV